MVVIHPFFKHEVDAVKEQAVFGKPIFHIS